MYLHELVKPATSCHGVPRVQAINESYVGISETQKLNESDALTACLMKNNNVLCNVDNQY